MNWRKLVDPVFPVVEPFDDAQATALKERLDADLQAIRTADWSSHEERALDEAQRIADAEADRVNKSEAKASTYLAALAALVPVILTIEAASWEKKSGPAPEWAKLTILSIATIYVAAAAFHAFRTLHVAGFRRVGEAELSAAWRSPHPLRRLTRETLLATRLSRDTVNSKVTGILLTRAHLVRAFAAFILLLLLDPLFYALGPRITGASVTEKPVGLSVDPAGCSHLLNMNPCKAQDPKDSRSRSKPGGCDAAISSGVVGAPAKPAGRR